MENLLHTCHDSWKLISAWLTWSSCDGRCVLCVSVRLTCHRWLSWSQDRDSLHLRCHKNIPNPVWLSIWKIRNFSLSLSHARLRCARSESVAASFRSFDTFSIKLLFIFMFGEEWAKRCIDVMLCIVRDWLDINSPDRIRWNTSKIRWMNLFNK